MSIHLLSALFFLAAIPTIVIGVAYLFLFGGTQKFLRGTLFSRYDGLELHNVPQAGDVQAVYHTYRGLLIWFTQDEHRVYGPPEEVRTFLQRMLKFNLTWGLLSQGVLFIPILAISNYYAQLRSISKQLSHQETNTQLDLDVQETDAFTIHDPDLGDDSTYEITATRSLFHRVFGWIAAGICFIFGLGTVVSLTTGEFESAAGGIIVATLFGSVARDWLNNGSGGTP